MENASKALLIAGSILIVILLIAMGVRVFNSTSGTTDAVDGTMQATEVAMFNNKFMPYIGNHKSKNEVLSLINLIIANNSTSNNKVTLVYGVSSSVDRIEGDTLMKLRNILTKVSNDSVNAYNVNNIGSEADIKLNQGRIFKIQITK